MEKLPKPGDRVRVPFGGFLTEGEVLRASDFGIGGIVTVLVKVEGAGDGIINDYRLERVEEATAV